MTVARIGRAGGYTVAYDRKAVDDMIKRDPRIKGKEARAIHAVLKGRGK